MDYNPVCPAWGILTWPKVGEFNLANGGYTFIRDHKDEYSVRRLSKMMEVHPSGFYAWCIEPESGRAVEDKRLLVPIKESWLESGAVYGYRKVHDDLCDRGEHCGPNRVYKICERRAFVPWLGMTSGIGSVVAYLRSSRQTTCSVNLKSKSRTESG